ncbi:uncharacterized protein LOC125041571 isoform X2 [Penaeus chinensis]|nr:uncharacterized protein LOC125041571 isoform X2 [Penaeus chinensis]
MSACGSSWVLMSTFAMTITRDRFDALTSAFHFAVNGGVHDRLRRLRPVLDVLESTYRSVLVPNKNVTVDDMFPCTWYPISKLFDRGYQLHTLVILPDFFTTYRPSRSAPLVLSVPAGESGSDRLPEQQNQDALPSVGWEASCHDALHSPNQQWYKISLPSLALGSKLAQYEFRRASTRIAAANTSWGRDGSSSGSPSLLPGSSLSRNIRNQ